MFSPNLKFVALPVPELIAIGVLGGVRTPNIGEAEPVGVGDGTVRKREGEFLWPHGNFSSIFTRVRDIAAFVLQHASFSHPTSIVSSKFPHVPHGSRWMAFGLRRGTVLARLVREISCQDFQPMWP